jgi:hypothetical protein
MLNRLYHYIQGETAALANSELQGARAMSGGMLSPVL